MTRKDAARTFLAMAATGDVQAAYDRFVAPDFVHHNQYFKGDRQSLLEAMTAATKAMPDKRFEVRHVWEDGDFVITHSHVSRANDPTFSVAVVHIVRFRGEKIVEMWDVGQPVQKDSPNEFGMF